MHVALDRVNSFAVAACYFAHWLGTLGRSRPIHIREFSQHYRRDIRRGLRRSELD